MCLVLSHMFPHLLVVTDLQKKLRSTNIPLLSSTVFFNASAIEVSPYQNANDLSSPSHELGLACKVPFQTEAEGIDHQGYVVGQFQ